MVLGDGGGGDYSGPPKGFSSRETTITGPVLSLTFESGEYALQITGSLKPIVPAGQSMQNPAPITDECVRGKNLEYVLSLGHVNSTTTAVILALASRLKEGDVVHIGNTVEFLVK
mgnify:CR=1 FL=1